MVTIGICDDHGASCAISNNGEILYAAGEERFTRHKNDAGFPILALDAGLRELNLSYADIDHIAIGSTERTDYFAYEYRRESVFGIQDYINLMEQYWKPKLAGKDYQKDLPIKIMEKNKNFKKEGFYKIPINACTKDYQNKDYQNFIIKTLSKYFSLRTNQISFIDHHTCHAYYALSTSKKPKSERFAVLTVDSYGDGKNQTIWIYENNNMKLVEESNSCLLARIYRFTTLYLGMRPNEHEYKVMGLSAYAKTAYSNQIKNKLKNIVKVKGLKITTDNPPINLYEYLIEIYKGERFDNIARAIQDLVEESLVELVINVSKEYGVKDFFYTGGVAMNVKANQKLFELEQVEKIIIPGAPDDQSIAIGACLFYDSKNKEVPFNGVPNMYLGTKIENIVENDIKNLIKNKSFISYKKSSINEVADIILNNGIVARAAGAMEFGARALGNRSIFALPNNWDNVDKINDIIKGRDFWMPFAGSVIDIDADKVIDGEWEKADPRFMTISFNTKEKFYSKFKAATHRKDKTIRAQIVNSNDNPWYYSLLLRIREKTGLGLLLNTSFNIHGSPIVCNLEEGFEVFIKTGLDHVILGNYLLKKI